MGATVYIGMEYQVSLRLGSHTGELKRPMALHLALQHKSTNEFHACTALRCLVLIKVIYTLW